MNTVDDLLAQSLLLHQPRVPSDVVGHEDLDYAGLTEALLLRDGEVPDRRDDRAAQSLAALCEAVVARCAPEQLADFLIDQVPQPRAAWILGCALRLAGSHDGARFWWQYAAGADDAPASYCLYLQHLAEGDTHAAALWQAQAGVHAPGDGQDADTDGGSRTHRVNTADAGLSTVLQVFGRLSRVTPRRHTPAAQAVIDFVATEVAIGYDRHPDLEIPLPGEEFAERLVVTATAFVRHPASSPEPRRVTNIVGRGFILSGGSPRPDVPDVPAGFMLAGASAGPVPARTAGASDTWSRCGLGSSGRRGRGARCCARPLYLADVFSAARACAQRTYFNSARSATVLTPNASSSTSPSRSETPFSAEAGAARISGRLLSAQALSSTLSRSIEAMRLLQVV